MADAGGARTAVAVLQDDGELPELSTALPKKHGIPPSAVHLWCVAGSNDLLVLGTNHSLVIVHHLRSLVTDKVSLEGSLKRSGVTALCLFPGMYNRIAMGRQHGLVNIYQFADAEVHKRRTMVKKVHSSSVTCLAWDTRGTLLFSADESGKVYATEVDMKEGKHYSWLVYECSSPIVEISYSSMMLLVSSTVSSVICHIARDITQRNPAKVGSKDRKVGDYGGCFATLMSGEEASLVVYVARPGLRIWRADHKGTVKATLKFKDIFELGNVSPIKLLGRRREASQGVAGGDVHQLGRLRHVCRKFLLAWHGDSLWLLDPATGQIAGFTSGLGQILDLCVHKRWVYVLREPPYARQSPVIRLGFDPSLVPLGSSPSVALFRNVGDTAAVRASESLLGVLPAAGASASEAVKSGDAPAAPGSEAGKASTETHGVVQPAEAAAAAATAVPDSAQSVLEGVVDDAPPPVVRQEIAAAAAVDQCDGLTAGEADDRPERKQQRAVDTDEEESQAVSLADAVQSATDAVLASAATAATPSPCPSPVLSSKTASTAPAMATAAAAVHASGTVGNADGGCGSASVASIATSTAALSTSPDGPTVTAADGVLARGEDVAQAAPSSPSPRAVRPRTPPCSEPNSAAASSSPSPVAIAPSSTTADAGAAAGTGSSSRPALRHAADSKTPVIPPQFDISLDESDTAVLIKPKAKRKGKKPKKSDSSSAIGAPVATSGATADKGISTPPSPGSSRASPARGHSPVRQPIVWVPSAGDANADSCPRTSAAEQPYAWLHPKGDASASASASPALHIRSTGAQCGAEGDVPSATAGGSTPSVERAVTTPTPRMALDVEATMPPQDGGTGAPDAAAATARLAAGGDASDIPPANAHGPAADAGADPAIENEAGAGVESGDVFTDGVDRSHSLDDSLRPEAGSDSLAMSPGFRQLMSSKSNPVLAISSAELASAEPVELEMHALAPDRHADDAPEASGGGGDDDDDDDNSSGANSVHHSGEHLTSIYDMGHTESDDTGRDAAAAAGSGHTAAHDIFVPRPAHAQPPAATAAAAAGAAAASAAGSKASTGSALLGDESSLSDSWVQCPAPCRNPLSEVTCTPTHIWVVDSKDYVYTWSLSKRRWINLKGSVRHMAASPSGDVIWACSKSGSLYHRAGIERRTRIGTEWRKMDMKVRSVAVDSKRGWVLTAHGGVKLRRDVTLAVPTGQQWDDMQDVPNNLRYLAAGHGVLWAITTHNVVLARLGVSRHKPLGTSWEMVCPGEHFLHVAIGSNDTAWLVNDDGVVCFMRGVCLATPCGDGQLWLSALGQFVVHDASLLEALWTWSLVKRSEPLRYAAAGQGCVAVLNATSALLYSGGGMVGTAYRTVSPPGVAVASMTWVSISASSVHSNGGRVWMLQRNGEVFCVKSGERPTVVQSPGRQQLTQVSSSLGSIWAVTSDGQIVERRDVNDYCPTGTSWKAVPVAALRGAKVRHVSCGLHCAWAVDERGQAWLRLGELGQMSVAAAAASASAASLWQAVEAPTAQCKFTQVVVGPGGWHVWAVDTTGCTYARIDVGIDNPAGACWQTVGGVNVSRLCISNSKVWAICANGNLVWRSSVTPRNPTGDYWKRIPGHFADLSVTPDDMLWLIDTDGYAFRRETAVYQGCVSPAKLAAGASLDTWVVV